MKLEHPKRDGTPASGVVALVEKATYVGSRMEYTVSADFGTVFVVQEDVDKPFAPGDPVWLGFEDRGPVLLPAE